MIKINEKLYLNRLLTFIRVVKELQKIPNLPFPEAHTLYLMKFQVKAITYQENLMKEKVSAKCYGDN